MFKADRRTADLSAGACGMKKLGIAFAIVAATMSILLWWSSLEARQAYRALVAELDARPTLRVLDSDYEAGWLRSNAVTKVEVRGAGGQAWKRALEALGRADVRARLGFRVTHDVEHGLLPLVAWIEGGLQGAPELVRVTSRVDLDQEARDELRGTTGPLPALLVTTTVRSNGVGEMHLAVPAQALEPRDSGEDPVLRVAGRWKGLQGHFVFSLLDGTTAGRLHAPGIDIASEDFRFKLLDLSVGVDTRRDPSGLLVGGLHPRIGRVAWAGISREVVPAEAQDEDGGASRERAPSLGASPPDDTGAEAIPERVATNTPEIRVTEHDAVVVDGIDLPLRAEVAQGALRIQIDLAVERKDRDGFVAGPGAARLVLRDVDAAALAGILADEAETGPLATLRRVADRSPVLELTGFTLDTPAGPLTGSAHARLAAERALRLVSPATAPTALDARMVFEGPAQALALLGAERAERLAESGFVEIEGDALRSEVELREGELVVNGEPLRGGETEEPAIVSLAPSAAAGAATP